MEKAILAREAASAVRGAAANIVAVAALSEEHKAEIERLETALRRGPEHGITTICFGEQVDDSLNVFGARLAFGESGAGLEEWALLLGRDPALILKPVEVRKEVLRPRLRLDEGADQWESKAPAEPIEGIADDVRDAESDEEAALPGGQLKESVADASEEADVGGLSEPPARTDSALNVPTAQVRRQATLLLVNEESAEVQAPEAASPVSIRTFGSFQVIANEREITDWKLQKARELLAYLVARGGTHVLRDEAAEALWPDEGVVQVDHLLSNAAHYLRRAIKGALPNPNVQVLLVSGQRYRLRPGLFRVDVDALDAHLRRAGMLKGTDALVEYERALAVYRGDFLGNEPFEWADAYRSEYQRRFAAAAHEAARLALDCRDARKAMKFYQAIIDRDPIDEKAARGLMRCCAKLGDTNGVRKVYKVFRESLRRELDDVKVEPLPETTALFHEFTVRSHGS